MLNGSDILNNAYTGSTYWDYGFGFNVTLPIEIYINFGFFGIIPMCFIGFVLGSILRNLDSRVIFHGIDPSWEVLKFYAVYTLCSSWAGLQWSVLFYTIYTVTRLRLKLRTPNLFQGS